MASYAEHKGLPAPRASVLASGGLLLFGGVSIMLGIFPAIGAGALALFLVGSAIGMHDFWAFDGEDAQDELAHFLENVHGAGSVVAFLTIATTPWPYALNIGL